MAEISSAIILAGGRSARMGTAKFALRFGDGSMIERMVAELGREFADVVVVAAPADAETERIETALGAQAARIRLVRDEEEYAGPARALVRGLEAARGEIAFACSCDLPLIRAEVARALCEMVGECDGAIAETGGRLQPLCAAYRRRAAVAIAARETSGEQRLTAIVAALDIRRVGEAELRVIDAELRSLVNVNTPADYARALKMAGVG